MSRYYIIFLIFSIIALNACSSSPKRKSFNAAEQLKQQGRPQKAAELYQHWAETQPDNEIQYRLKAIDLLLEAGNGNTAKAYADALQQRKLTKSQQSYLALLNAEISLNFGNAEMALSHLNSIQLEHLTTEQQIKFYKAQAFSHSLTGNLLGSVVSRISLNQILPPTLQIKNGTAILETLSLLSDAAIQSQQTNATNILKGWLDLTLILKQRKQNPDNFNVLLENWKTRFPLHPANNGFLQNYFSKPLNAFSPPSAIAVLLPDTGPYAKAAQAIYEGFMAAYYQDNNPNKPSLRFYNSEQGDIANLYHQAVVEGAELIIGPLSKHNIKQLSDTLEFKTPVLALNQIPELSKSNFFQFGLNPEDEIDQITGQAMLDGYKKALILTPDTDQGLRIAKYFSEYWQRINGTVLENQSYNPKATDFSESIKSLLNLNESLQRYQKIRKLIPFAKFTPRRRQDVDVIFLNADNTTARLINPQLRFYHANHVPVYATPEIYTGIQQPIQDIDLNNITFCDAPWLFDSYYQGQPSQADLQDKSQQFPNQYLRLIALGIDAYNLIEHLNNLDNVQYQGATGYLLLTDQNKIKRNLICAKFSQGIPMPIDYEQDLPEETEIIYESDNVLIE